MRKNTNTNVNGLLIFFTLLIVSCNNKKDAIPHNIIPVANTVGNYKMLNISEYATDIKYIPLETNDSALISGIDQIIYENEKILLLGYNNCYLFDNKGKFCRKIGQYGQGPDEYLLIAQVSMYDNFIFLMDKLKILIYDVNGRLIGKNSLKSNTTLAKYSISGLFGLLPLKKDTFVMNVTEMSEYYPKAILFETHTADVKIINEYAPYINIDKVQAFISTDDLGVMYRFKEDIRIYKVINDTVFTIGQNMEMKDAFIFDLGKHKPALSYMEGREDFFSARKKYIIPLNIFESPNYLFIRFDFGHNSPEPVESINRQGGSYTITDVCSVFDKVTGKLILMKQPVKGKLGFKNDIDNGPVIWPRCISSHNELVTFISAEEFLDCYKKIETPTANMTEIANQIDRDDNPILVIVKLKE